MAIHWPNYVTVREFIRMDRPRQRRVVDEQMKPNKFQRLDNENTTPATPVSDLNLNDENMELGFQQ